MQKHAKKSLLVPILAFVSVVAIAACCYLAQSFLAFAEEEANLESTSQTDEELRETLPPDITQLFSGDGVIRQDNPSPTATDVRARIHLSTGDPFGGTYIANMIGESVFNDFYAWTGEQLDIFKDNEVLFAVTDFGVDFDEYTRVAILASNAPDEPLETDAKIYIIELPKRFYAVSNINITYTVGGDAVDITIVVTPSYYIGFNANGGKYDDSSTTKWVSQGEHNTLVMPKKIPSLDGKEFGGWYTHPIWGERISDSSQAPAWGEVFMLYAHWIDNSEPFTFHFSTGDFTQMFQYKLTSVSNDGENILNDESGITWTYTKVFKLNNNSPNFNIGLNEDNKILIQLVWTDVSNTTYTLTISPISGQRINGISINGCPVSLLSYFFEFSLGEGLSISQYNDIEISIGWAMPGYISVASDNGKMFKCAMASQDIVAEDITFVSDYCPIFLGADDYVTFMYGGSLPFGIGLPGFMYDIFSSSKLVIIVFNLANIENQDVRFYGFGDNLFTLFDWFEINSYITGLNIDGEDYYMSNYMYKLDNGFHSFVLQMNDKDVATTVTYKANGGAFADGSDSMTLDATYGEALPVVENPALVENDFVGWFTEAEGGVQVDPANYQWNPWDRWNGVTLYAHWAYNPQPVPPEPVPPEPGPTPVDPDNPGGGGTAQTGDSAPLMPIAALAVIAAICCGLAVTRKQYLVLIK